MLDSVTKRRIDTARDILVGKVPDPKSQVEQITIALIYKFMDDMDAKSEELGGKREFFSGEYDKYGWKKLMAPNLGGFDVLNLYTEAIQKMNVNPNIPQLFRDIFKNAYLPYRDPETLKSFLKIIDDFEYDHSEKLGDAFEYLLSVLGSQGDAGQFRTPRHIIDFMIDIIDPKKDEKILDPACGTAGFLISSYKHIIKHNSSNYTPEEDKEAFNIKDVSLTEITAGSNGNYMGDKLTPDERAKLSKNIIGYDISPDMVRLSLVNLYLHGFTDPKISEYDTLTNTDNWNEYADVIFANPPFMSPKGGIKPHKRFTIQAKRSEVLFVDYMVEHLTSKGRAAIIVPEGIIFQSGTAYKQLRKMLVENYLFGVVSLPAGVFNPYSGVKTSILLIDKNLNKKTDKILFVKIENDGFDLGAQRRPNNKSELPEILEQIKKYISTVSDGQEFETENVKNILTATKDKVGENEDWNLSCERYTSSVILSTKYNLVSLEDITIKITDGTHKTPKYTDSGIPFLRVTDITHSNDSKKFISTEEHIELIKRCNPEVGDVLYSKNGTIGVAKLIDWDYEFSIFVSLALLKPKKELINSKYLEIFLNSKKTNEQVISRSKSGTVTNLHLIEIKQIQIPLPPLEFQKEIVAEIDGYQKIIDGARQVVENYKPQIRIDPDWEIVKLGEICDFSQGVQVDLEFQSKTFIDGYEKFLRIENYTQNSTDFRFIPKDLGKNKYVSEDDVVVVRYGASAGFIGRGFKGILANNLFKVTPKNEKLSKSYLFNILSSTLAQNYFSKSVAGGAMPALSFAIVKELLIPLPSQDEQNREVTRVDKENQLVKSNFELISIFEQKIKNKIASVWGE